MQRTRSGHLRAICVSLLLGFSNAAHAQVTWNVDNTTSIGGNTTTVIGNPIVVSTPFGDAVRFDGNDGLIVNTDPVAGAANFTVEMLFRPDPIMNALSNVPRVLHLQSMPSPPDHRATLEGRIVAGNQWYIDTFLQSQSASSSNPNVTTGLTLIEPTKLHPLSQWYNYALVYDGFQLKSYLNGQLESSGALAVQKMAVGRTSLGMRINQVNFFEGVIAKVRFTPSVVDPANFLSARIPGDYDQSGAVDELDYIAWKTTFGSSVAIAGDAADGNGNGIIDAADYTFWRDRASLGAGSLSPGENVPEPSSFVFLALICLFRSPISVSRNH